MQKTIHLSLENDHDDDNDAHDVMLVIFQGGLRFSEFTQSFY